MTDQPPLPGVSHKYSPREAGYLSGWTAAFRWIAWHRRQEAAKQRRAYELRQNMELWRRRQA